MEVIGRDNNVKKAFLGFPAILDQIIDSFSDDVFAKAIPAEKLKEIEHVVITGNGDSYCAALATKEFNARMFRGADYQALRCIEASRHHVYNEENPEKTLTIVISVSGGGSRVTEAMARARKKGCTTLAVTKNADSRMAKEAEYVLPFSIQKPDEESPAFQALTFSGAVITTLLFGMYAGKLRGTITEEEAAKQKQAMRDYFKAVCSEEVLSRIDDQMFDLADSWKEYLGFDFIGGGADFAVASFGSAKFFELIGSLNCINDCEDWCHIEYFQTKRPQLGLIAHANKEGASYSRCIETVGSAIKSDRNVLVVTDGDAGDWAEGTVVAKLPAVGYDYIAPAVSYIPVFMLGNYICIKRGYEYFGGMGDSNPLFSFTAGINTIRTSEVVYVD